MTPERVEFFPDVLEEFFEELDFLWCQRESVIFAPDWTLRDLAELEERAEAHLDGLRLSGDDGVRLALPHLRGDEKGGARAATFVLMEAGRPELDREVLAALVEAEVPAKEGIGDGLRHVEVSRIAAELRKLAVEGDLVVRSIAADVLAFHRLGPPPPKMIELFGAADPEVRARAHGAAGRFGGPWSPDELKWALEQPHSGLRWAAIHASARLAMPGLAEQLRRAAMRVEVPAPEAIEFLGVLGDPNDLQLFRGLMKRPALAEAAIAALGAAGRIEGVPLLLEAMRDPVAGPAASAAFARITAAEGIALRPVVEAGDDDPFVDRPPALDADGAEAWWKEHGGRLAPDKRWQLGLDVATEPADAVLDSLPLGYRRDARLRRAALGASPAAIELESRVSRR